MNAARTTSGIAETKSAKWGRHLPASTAVDWLRAGWRDLIAQPGLSLTYGVAVLAVSLVIVWGMFLVGWDVVLFPALAGFMIVGPLLAVGLYEKSRLIEKNQTATMRQMLFVKARSGGQILFVGVLLCLLMLVWMRAAVIIYALFFGYRPFPGFENIAAVLFTTWTGWVMLLAGIIVGGLFAAFSFAISAFSVPMLLDEKSDAFTAMGTSMALVWNNLPVMLAWGAIVVALFLLSAVTGLLALIVVFPLLGHATWQAYKAVR
ncbi:DUF2189 domain-containing protein [Aurantimonas marina]|uniref:DUF2189 domain-containing protein n=1 Tax=Aurantimonas marina TaxID=2780508 RepID=UPI0019D19177|nr:DUF2189 domain-containing protein [Aurantimonas marina]